MLAVVLVMLAAATAGAAPPATGAEAGAAPALSGPFHWVSTGPLITAQADPQHPLTAIKDPTVVFYNGLWHIYASSVTDTGTYSMVYLSFADWKDAAAAPQFHLDANANLRGYHCAPQVFYFAPQKLWYLVYQSQQPTYSTTPDMSKPQTWSKPQNFFATKPKTVVDGWLDYWVICDETHAYLFFSDDQGRFYRSRTTLAEFPKGFDDPVVALQATEPRELFEASCTYHIQGTHQYLALIEAANEHWNRYYKAFIADRLDGTWRPLAAEWGNSFADTTRIRTEDGSKLWTNDISHGELLRDGYDQTLTIDPAHLRLLYQGIRVGAGQGKPYNQLPWQLGLLTRQSASGAGK
jgi:hypothetical protein